LRNCFGKQCTIGECIYLSNWLANTVAAVDASKNRASKKTERFILYVDGARYYDSLIVKEWLKRHPVFHLSPIPAYSPNVNLIERMWKFLRAKALCRWHKTFEDMQAAVSEVLDHLEGYRGELRKLMTETFHIIDKLEIPVQYRGVA